MQITHSQGYALACKTLPLLAQYVQAVTIKVCCMMQPEMLRRARVYDSHTRWWALITPGQDWEDGEVCPSFSTSFV